MMGKEKVLKQQMKLKNFCDEFDIPRTTVLKWIYDSEFPAYNLCGHWYVDMEKFYNWRQQEHLRSYKYA